MSAAGARTRLPVAGLLLAVLAAYANALAGPFQFDDYRVIADNPAVHGLAAWWASMPGIRPLLKLSYALNWALAPHAWGFHAVNLAVHAANTLLVYAVARQWLPRLAPVAAGRGGAGWIALLFALHPAATEAVTYVSGRSISLMALFYLAAMWTFVQGETLGRRTLSRVASPLLFALALSVRETAVTLPAALAALAWYAGAGPRQALRGLGGHALVLAVAAMAALSQAGYQRFFHYSLETRDLGAQLLGQTEAYAHLVGHTLLALRTNIDPDLAVPAAWGGFQLAMAAGMAAAVLVAVLARPRWPWLGFGLAWILLQLAPSNSLLPRFDLANDRHLYLALPGFAMLLVVPLLARPAGRIGAAALLCLALVAGLATHRRNHDYRSETALWQATVRVSPAKARPWANLGWARQESGDHAGARAAYECALALDPGHQQALVNLALLAPAAPGPGRPNPDCPRR